MVIWCCFQIGLLKTGGGTYEPTLDAQDNKLIDMLKTQFYPSQAMDSDTGYHTFEAQESVST